MVEYPCRYWNSLCALNYRSSQDKRRLEKTAEKRDALNSLMKFFEDREREETMRWERILCRASPLRGDPSNSCWKGMTRMLLLVMGVVLVLRIVRMGYLSRNLPCGSALPPNTLKSWVKNVPVNMCMGDVWGENKSRNMLVGIPGKWLWPSTELSFEF
jgi:hypothetical protein